MHASVDSNALDLRVGGARINKPEVSGYFSSLRTPSRQQAELGGERCLSVRDLRRRTKPLRGGEDRDLGKRSASATHPTGSQFSRRLNRRTAP
jgi:hypothetical protein